MVGMPPEVHVPTIIIHPVGRSEGLVIPRLLGSLEHFRAWCHGADFPEHGRIDWIAGDLEVDMRPEEINSHSSVKTACSRRPERSALP